MGKTSVSSTVSNGTVGELYFQRYRHEQYATYEVYLALFYARQQLAWDNTEIVSFVSVDVMIDLL